MPRATKHKTATITGLAVCSLLSGSLASNGPALKGGTKHREEKQIDRKPVSLTFPFTAGTSIPTVTGCGPSSVALGDFDEDGHLDLVVACHSNDSVEVFPGHGNGTFRTTARVINTNAYPVFVLVDDFDGDNHKDIAVVEQNNDTVGILFGKGDGTFETELPLNVGYYGGGVLNHPHSVAVGDFNGDSVKDLAVANIRTEAGNTGYVSTLIGLGSRSFDTTSNWPANDQPHAIVTGAFNKSNDISEIDLVVSNGKCNDHTLSFLYGDGMGNFTLQSAATNVGQKPVNIAVDDFNGDGLPDLAVANLLSDRASVSVAIGNGDRTFSVTTYPTHTTTISCVGTNPPTCETTSAVGTGDFTGDGKTDIVATNSYLDIVAVLVGNGDATFMATPLTTTLPAGDDGPRSIAVGSINDLTDSKLDLAIANVNSDTISIYLQN